MRLFDMDSREDYLLDGKYKVATPYAPCVDVVEVVRCQNCEWWRCNPNTKNYGVCKKVSYDDFEVVMESDDFCSYGVRREDCEA